MGTEHPTMVDIDAFTLLLWVTTMEETPYDFAFKALDWDKKLPKTKAFYEAMRSVPEFDAILARKEHISGFLTENFSY